MKVPQQIMKSITQWGGCHGAERKEEIEEGQEISSAGLETWRSGGSIHEALFKRDKQIQILPDYGQEGTTSAHPKSFLFENTLSLPSCPPLPPPLCPVPHPWPLSSLGNNRRKKRLEEIAQLFDLPGAALGPLPGCPSPLPAHSKSH